MKPYVGTEPIKDVLSWNLHRRHLTTSQRAMIATAVLPMLEEQAKERMKEAGAKGAAIAGKGRPAQNDRGWANLPTPNEREEKHRAADDAASMLSVSSRAVQTAKKVQQAAPYLRLMLGVAISRGGGTGTPWALSQPKTVSVRFTRAGLCRVSTRLSFGGGGTGSRASALNTFPQDRHRLNPGLSLTAALCHDPQKHLRRGAMRTPSAVVTDSEVFSMGLPLHL